MLTKTLSEAKKKQRSILIKAMNNDVGSIDSSKDSWNPAQISERAKDISYIRSLVDSWNPAQLNEALKMLDLPVIDTWNPAQIEEQRRNIVFYLSERTLTGNPITINILGNITPEVTGLKVTMNPIQDLHGYDNPWVGGAGKNKAPVFPPYSEHGITLTNGELGELIINGTPDTQVDLSVNLPELESGTYTVSTNNNQIINQSNTFLECLDANNTRLGVCVYTSLNAKFTFTGVPNMLRLRFDPRATFTNFILKIQLESGSTATDYAPYENICPIIGRTEVSVTRTAGEDVETKTHEYNETIWWATDDFANGGMEACGAEIASYNGETLPGEWLSDRDVYAPGTTPTIGAQVVYKNTPTTIETSAEEITLLKGTNVLSTDGDSIELKYKQNF